MPTSWLWCEIIILPENVHSRNSVHDIFTHLGSHACDTIPACTIPQMWRARLQFPKIFQRATDEKKEREYKIPNTFFDPSEQEKAKPDLSVNSFHLPLHGDAMRSGGGAPPRRPYTPPPLRSKDLWVILQASLHGMCLNSCKGDEMPPCIHACIKHGSMNPTHMNLHRWTYTYSSFTDFGIKFMPCFLDIRRSSATDTAAPVSTKLSDVWPKLALWRIVC